MHKIIISKKDFSKIDNTIFNLKNGLLFKEFIFPEVELLLEDQRNRYAIRQLESDPGYTYVDIYCNRLERGLEVIHFKFTGVMSDDEIKAKTNNSDVILPIFITEPMELLSSNFVLSEGMKSIYDTYLGASCFYFKEGEQAFAVDKRIENKYGHIEGIKDYYHSMGVYCSAIYRIMNYIMVESFKRKSVELAKQGHIPLEEYDKSRKHRKIAKQDKYLLNTIINYAATEISVKHYIKCECWDVRGHYRHYKNGKVVFIKSYEKGKKRNTGYKKNSNEYLTTNLKYEIQNE